MYEIMKDNNGKGMCIIRTADGVCIPFDPDNTDYQQYLKWVEAGNTPLPADEGAA